MNVSQEEKIKQAAIDAGFDYCGIAKSEELILEKEALIKSVEKGYHAGMGFLARGNAEQRANPGLLMESAKSVIITLTSY